MRPPVPQTEGSCGPRRSVDSTSEMQAGSTDRGLERLVAPCASLDPGAPTARERLEEKLGPELARKLVFALAARERNEDRSPEPLRPRAIFAA